MRRRGEKGSRLRLAATFCEANERSSVTESGRAGRENAFFFGTVVGSAERRPAETFTKKKRIGKASQKSLSSIGVRAAAHGSPHDHVPVLTSLADEHGVRLALVVRLERQHVDRAHEPREDRVRVHRAAVDRDDV